MTDRLIIDARELAALLSVPLSSIRHGFGPPALSGYGRRKRWRRADVEAWIAQLPTEETTCPSAADQVADSSTRDSKSTAVVSSARRGSKRAPRIDPLLERKPRRSKPKSDAPPAQVIPLRPVADR